MQDLGRDQSARAAMQGKIVEVDLRVRVEAFTMPKYNFCSKIFNTFLFFFIFLRF